MEIILYKIDCNFETLDKTQFLSNGITLDYLKCTKENEYLNPTLLLKYDIRKFNYCYISDYDRYYFIDNVTMLNGGLFEVDLEEDLLYSHIDEIKNITADLNESEKINDYSETSDLNSVQKMVYDFENPFIDSDYMLVTVKGV